MTWSHLLFALIGWLVIEGLIWIVRSAMKEGEPQPDSFAEPHGDVPHTGGRNG